MAHTAKTKKILDLFSGEHEAAPAVNPAIKPPDKEPVPQVFVKSGNGEQAVNIAYLLLNEQVLPIMERFHCCTCDGCVGTVMDTSLEALPRVIVRAKRKADEDEVNKAAEDMRTEAVRVITKAVISVKTDPKH